jgi:hypothetical protein
MESKGATIDTLTDRVREWYERSPTAQRAYARLRADIDTVIDQAKPRLDEFWQQIGPMIDPPAKDDSAPHQDRVQDAGSTSAGTSGGRVS